MGMTNTAITESTSWECPYCHKTFNMSNIDWSFYIQYLADKNRDKKWFSVFPYCNKKCKFLNALKGVS